MTINDELRAASAQIERGNKAAAKDKLVTILKTDPENQVAWLLLSYAVDDADQRRECLERVLEIDPTTKVAKRALERTALKRTPSPAPETRARSKNLLDRIGERISVPQKELIIAAGLVGAAILILAAFGALAAVNRAQHRHAAATATTAHRACLEDFEDTMLKLLSEFFRQETIADTTPRINLPEQISRLEDIRTRAWNMSSKSCRPRWHRLLMDYMDKSIASYVSFSAEDPDYVWNEKYLESLEALAALDDAVIDSGHSGGLVAIFRQRGYFYWEKLDEPDWKKDL